MIEVRLPKTFVEFKSSKSSRRVEAEILGSLWSGYQAILQKKVDSLGFTVEIAPRMSKVVRIGNVWMVYLKAVVAGVPDDYTTKQIELLLTKMESVVDEAMVHISQRLKHQNLSATNIKATFRRIDTPELVRNG